MQEGAFQHCNWKKRKRSNADTNINSLLQYVYSRDRNMTSSLQLISVWILSLPFSSFLSRLEERVMWFCMFCVQFSWLHVGSWFSFYWLTSLSGALSDLVSESLLLYVYVHLVVPPPHFDSGPPLNNDINN